MSRKAQRAVLVPVRGDANRLSFLRTRNAGSKDCILECSPGSHKRDVGLYSSTLDEDVGRVSKGLRYLKGGNQMCVFSSSEILSEIKISIFGFVF